MAAKLGSSPLWGEGMIERAPTCSLDGVGGDWLKEDEEHRILDFPNSQGFHCC